jgi:hypothetical protein
VKNPSRSFAGATRVDGPFDGGFQLSDPRRQAQAALGDLVAIGMTRVNVLLTGVDDVVQNILETIQMDLRTPVASWYPGERLVLPPVSRTGTMILHDVGDEPRRSTPPPGMVRAGRGYHPDRQHGVDAAHAAGPGRGFQRQVVLPVEHRGRRRDCHVFPKLKPCGSRVRQRTASPCISRTCYLRPSGRRRSPEPS